MPSDLLTPSQIVQRAEAHLLSQVTHDLNSLSLPQTAHTQAEIMPAVSEALSRIAGERPSSPLRLLGEHLIREAQKVRTVCDNVCECRIFAASWEV